MINSTDEFAEDLAALQTRIMDTLNGFDEIQRNAEPEIQSIIAEHVALHTRHVSALSSRLRSLGCEPDTDGSFFSLVQRAIIKTRAVFTDIDGDVLDAVAGGEERLLEMYSEAEGKAVMEPDRAMLAEQRAALESLIARTRKKAQAA